MPDLGLVLRDRFLEVGVYGCEGCKAAAGLLAAFPGGPSRGAAGSACALGDWKAVSFRLCSQGSQVFL